MSETLEKLKKAEENQKKCELSQKSQHNSLSSFHSKQEETTQNKRNHPHIIKVLYLTLLAIALSISSYSLFQYFNKKNKNQHQTHDIQNLQFNSQQALQEIMTAYKNNQYDESLKKINIFKTHINSKPLTILNIEALIYKKMKNISKAFELYTEAINLYPSNAVGYNNRGSLYIEQENFLEAIKDLKTASDLDPKTSEITLNLAVAYEKNKEWKKAQVTYSEYLKKIIPGNAEYEKVKKRIIKIIPLVQYEIKKNTETSKNKKAI